MFSVYDLRKSYESALKDGKSINYTFICDSRNTDEWYAQYDSGLKVPAKELVDYIRKQIGQDFENLYSCHATLESFVRCKKCGTVIFAYNDERYEPNLCCPVCSDYETDFEYWTKEQIDADENKQRTITNLEMMQKEQDEAYARRKRRGGKYDWQLARWKKWGKRHYIILELQCDSILNKFKLKGLRLRVDYGDIDFDDGHGYRSGVRNMSITIPLSISYAVLLMRIRIKRYKNKKAGKNEWDF